MNPSKSETIAFYNPRSKPLAASAESIETVLVAGSPSKLKTSIKNLSINNVLGSEYEYVEYDDHTAPVDAVPTGEAIIILDAFDAGNEDAWIR